ncbi:MAG: dTDP-4-dehydrorhamnose reductase [Planctomycetes bacterium]|nr:dTDP-4-dehydrorhamnose reductase [Planctomycetota bacterium]
MSQGARRILLFGGDGQVGLELQRSLTSIGTLIVPTPSQADFSRPSSLREVVRYAKPEIVVNAAAYTAVDKAESESELARRINAESPGVMAEEAAMLGALLIHYSTDAVYDGTKGAPYVESDAPNPINQYGRSKWEGDQAVAAAGGRFVILRTSWVYASHGHNFVRTILRLACERDEIRVVNDQFGNPTEAGSLADATAQVVQRVLAAPGDFASEIYHATGTGSTSWFEFAQAIVGLSPAAVERGTKVVPIPSSDYPLPAPRSKNGRLDCGKLFNAFQCRLPPWRESLREVVSRCADGCRQTK